uniref:DUF19 domain-containing protein n=1 Tax=Caenorhabditis tropicalis TaxID=1561998 RepID=A0A1I7T4U9_9PELO
MTKGGGSCFVLWICLAMITIPFYVFRAQSYIFHGKLGCSSVFHEANGLIEKELNDTRRILKSPNYYSNISKLCQEADKCSHVIKNSVEHSGLALSHLCPFFIFYNGPFSTCGDRLISKIGQNNSCIDVIFRSGIELNGCPQWENCLNEQIESTCDDLFLNSTKTTEYFTIFQEGFCSWNSTSLEIEQEELDTSEEILELSEA